MLEHLIFERKIPDLWGEWRSPYNDARSFVDTNPKDRHFFVGLYKILDEFSSRRGFGYFVTI